MLSLLPRDVVFEHGLPSRAIIGVFTGEQNQLDLEHFEENPEFLEVLHAVVARFGPHSRDLKRAARSQRTGSVFMIDQRTPTPGGDVPPEDLIGAWSVDAGRLGEYMPNPRYRAFGVNGSLRLPPDLERHLIGELTRHAVEGGDSPGGGTSSTI